MSDKMGHECCRVDKIRKMTYFLDTLTVEFKSGEIEKFERVRPEWTDIYLSFRSIDYGEIEFEIWTDVEYDPLELEREYRINPNKFGFED